MNARQPIGKVVGIMLLSLTLVAGCIVPPIKAPATTTPAQAEPTTDGEVYTDPAGRFSAPIPTNWTATVGEGYVLLRDPEQAIRVYLLALDAADPQAAVADAWALVDPTLTLAVDKAQEVPATGGVDQLYLVQYKSESADQFYQAVARMVDDTAYLMLVAGALGAVQRRNAQLNIINTGLTISSLAAVDLADVEPLPVDDAIRSQLHEFIARGVTQYGIPGVAVGVVQNGEVVYQETFGTTVLGGDVPITPQTQMMIGSTGKSLTTLLMATLVDAGLMSWDTPVVQILPQFKVADAKLTQTITMRNLVCACTGVPRRDLEIVFNGNELTAEDVVTSLQSFEFFTGFGETFQYSNQMVATGGFATAAADGATFGHLEEGYVASLTSRVLGPVGMPNTTISFADVLARDTYAMPHALSFGAKYELMTIKEEQSLAAFAPAGEHWSTLEDMTNYLIMALNKGVAVDGTQVVSAENLRTTWEPQVPVSADTSYGLGWFVGEYKGVPLIQHAGNTLGFTSDFAFLPEDGLGIVVLTNARASNFFNGAVRTRLFELVFAQQPEAEAQADFSFAQMQEQLVEPPLFAPGLAEAALTPYLGTFHNDALGNLTVTLTDGVLTADAGEFTMILVPTEQDGKVQYVVTNGLLAGLPLTFAQNETGVATIALGAGVEQYTFTRTD